MEAYLINNSSLILDYGEESIPVSMYLLVWSNSYIG